MQDESTIFAVAFYPLLHLLLIPLFIFRCLQVARHFGEFLRNRRRFLALYFVINLLAATTSFYFYFQLVRTLDSCFNVFLVAFSPFFMMVMVVILLPHLLKVINHFVPIWDSDEKFMDIYLVGIFTVLFVSFVAFFFVVINSTFCA